MEIPAISVIIPLYNAEKFIGECLDSLLAQTFQNFEVIVVDDCSIDNSAEIVKNYAEKFGERLIFTATKKNSGGGGYIPRNIGLGLSRGEYIFFVDADDFIKKNALQNAYAMAKKFDADVVYTSAYYSYNGADNVKLKRDTEGIIYLKNGRTDKATLTRDNPNQNFRRLLLGGGSFHMPWTKFVQRKTLIENEIKFPKIFSGGDFIWTIQVFYFAKKLLRVPISLYFYRENAFESITRQKNTSHEQIVKCVNAFILGAKSLHELSEKIDLLKKPHYMRAALSPFFYNCLERSFDERMKLLPQDLHKILSSEFENDSSASIVSFLFSVVDEQQKFLIQTQRRIAKLKNELDSLKTQ